MVGDTFPDGNLNMETIKRERNKHPIHPQTFFLQRFRQFNKVKLIMVVEHFPENISSKEYIATK